MEDTRPAKRAKQACEPCRRKKSKCPGERPACSYCERLGQLCVYETGSDYQGQRTRLEQWIPITVSKELRMESLEEKLDFFMDRLDPVIQDSHRRSASRQMAGRTTCSVEGASEMAETIDCGQSEPDPSTSNSLLMQSRSHELASLYITWLHRQPLIMFNAETFGESLPNRDTELVLALQALCFRFPLHSPNTQPRQRLVAMARASRQLVMDKVFGKKVDCSSLQTLCLLSFFDYTEGNIVQSGLYLSMLIQFMRAIPKDCILGDAVEFNDCVRSTFILYHLQGSISPSVWPTTLPHGEDIYSKPLSSSGRLTPPNNTTTSEMDQGIMQYTTPLTQVWREARAYISCRLFSDMLPPWNPRSDYSQIAYRHLEIDCSVPLKYRYSASRIEEQTSDSLQQNRGHWSPYLFIQLVYASIPVILNHPFLLSMRLRNFRHTMPQSFINSSFDAITRHIGWIMYHLELMNRMDYEVSDPTIAHIVVIVATIHLQHSFVEDHSLRGNSQSGFGKCLEFLQRMGAIWPSVGVMHENLRKLQQSIQVISVPPETPELTGILQQKFTIDTRLLWDLLSYEQAGRSEAHVDRSMFHGLSSLNHGTASHEAEPGTGYDLVGSAGIIGHKTVPKDTPIFAPCESDKDRSEACVSVSRGSLQQNIRNGFGSVAGPANVFPQAVDYGRAIDEWLSLDWENTMF